jgi:hypothetical protein
MDVPGACQRLITLAGNVRAGSSCAGPGVYTVSHRYSSGSPNTIAGCMSSFTASLDASCLACTP